MTWNRVPIPPSPAARLLGLEQFSGMRDFTAGDGANLISGNGHNGSRSPCQGDELDFVGLVLRINMNNGSNIARFKPLLAERCRQNHSVVLANHI